MAGLGALNAICWSIQSRSQLRYSDAATDTNKPVFPKNGPSPRPSTIGLDGEEFARTQN
jgi:hypothetical protein